MMLLMRKRGKLGSLGPVAVEVVHPRISFGHLSQFEGLHKVVAIPYSWGGIFFNRPYSGGRNLNDKQQQRKYFTSTFIS